MPSPGEDNKIARQLFTKPPPIFPDSQIRLKDLNSSRNSVLTQYVDDLPLFSEDNEAY